MRSFKLILFDTQINCLKVVISLTKCLTNCSKPCQTICIPPVTIVSWQSLPSCDAPVSLKLNSLTDRFIPFICLILLLVWEKKPQKQFIDIYAYERGLMLIFLNFIFRHT